MNAPDVRRWVEVLDRIASDTAALRAALDDDAAIELPTWTPPDDLGPLPEALRPRAQAVLADQEQVRVRTRARLQELSAELGDLQQRRHVAMAYANESATTA